MNIEDKVENVIATMRIEGMEPTREEIDEIRDVISGRRTGDAVRADIYQRIKRRRAAAHDPHKTVTS